MGDMTEPATAPPETFDFGEMLGDQHLIGAPGCEAGWCGGDYPRNCGGENCQGLIHANFGDESYDGDYWLYTKCDVCGEAEA